MISSGAANLLEPLIHISKLSWVICAPSALHADNVANVSRDSNAFFMIDLLLRDPSRLFASDIEAIAIALWV
jgi:hypothetical protein